MHSCKSRTPKKIIGTPNKLWMHLVVGYLANYAHMHIYHRILEWTTIDGFSSTYENEASVLSRLILWASSKFIINNFKNIKNSLVNIW